MGQLTKQFGKIKVSVPIPHLLNLQVDSYNAFLQEGRKPEERDPHVGLEGVFRSVFPIEDYNRTASLEYLGYEISEPKFDQAECITNGLTYEAPVRIKVRLDIYDNDENGNRTYRDGKEQDIFFGTLPLMTEKGTFIVNGTERVIVNQLQRSPGIIFEHDGGKTHSSHHVLYSCRVIPMRGSWIDFDFDHKDILYVRIDRRRKMPATILFKAMGMSKQQILDTFYDSVELHFDGQRVYVRPDVKFFEGFQAYRNIADADGNVIVKEGKKLTGLDWKKLARAKVEEMDVPADYPLGLYLAEDIINSATGEIVAEAGEEVREALLEQMGDLGIHSLRLLYTRGKDTSTSILDTLKLDRVAGTEKAQGEIYRRMRPSSPPTPEAAKTFFDNIFRNAEYYNLSAVGRYKINLRLGLDIDRSVVTLTDEDIISAIKVLVRMKDTNAKPDDIDHLGNRRVRLVGELVENQYRIGLVRMERAIKERMNIQQDVSQYLPHDLINPKPVSGVLKEFFGTSQLSQFMDQTNSLSEVTHKRRLSALGPGGLNRERAGFEVRDVHTSHYGRICPIETPEGPNIGLIVSLTTYAKVNEFGFIETPYRKVKNGCPTDEIVFMDASCEKKEVIAQADEPVENGRFKEENLTVRTTESGDVLTMSRDEVTLQDISPSQMVSISAALIPFLEHDDANRALMGSNMQRQAVPLLRSERPLVGTGMEYDVARDSGACLLAEGDGIVRYADADRIIVAYDDLYLEERGGIRSYDLLKFHKSNQNSCFGQKPTCMPGQRVKKGDILADGPGIENGELALGKNLVVAFMPWCGYNYEDAVLISERAVRDDIYTSIHIEEFEVVARDTKLGPEEITRDIPNLGEDMLHNLDASGVIRIGASVKADDILVGKITPKGETQLTPEEKLLRAIFGEKARDVKNSSLKVPPGIEGTVIDVKVFNRRSGEKDDRIREIEEYEIARLDRKEADHVRALSDRTRERMRPLMEGQVLNSDISEKGAVLAAAGNTLSWEVMQSLPVKKLGGILRNKDANAEIFKMIAAYEHQLDVIKKLYDSKREKVTEGDDLPPGVIKMVKVHVAIKRKLSVGDKMAGRHGNKGVVSMILPEEDMPFFADGRPVDVVLNPLGVPSRMNIGQIMETHLGWAAKELGRQLAEMVDNGVAMKTLRAEVKDIFAADLPSARSDGMLIDELVDSMSDDELKDAVRSLRKGIITKTPVFDGAQEKQIWDWLERAGLPSDGKTQLFDGRTGEPFANRVTTGVMYYLKLHHLVDEKIHARSTGPYSLVTQQPLGGKAQFGGQRLGEMEVWALEGYGASYLLQEFLTVKSDDVAGRVKIYEKIVKGNNFLESGLPESFNVLVKELMSLGLNVNLEQEESKKPVKQRFFHNPAPDAE
ncbi:MAG: DNA-directed RNA polymerase subunit beta [Mailhella sp.]|nr:DNA-directed RNA polymerase subunit beta [Mailhella sp.]